MAEPKIPPVETLTDSSDDAPKLPRRQGGASASRTRKRQASNGGHVTKRRKTHDVLSVQAMLAKSPCDCNRKCLDHFRSKAGLRELLKWKTEWEGFHKLDQDRIATR